jgi:hypothetical protein
MILIGLFTAGSVLHWEKERKGDREKRETRRRGERETRRRGERETRRKRRLILKVFMILCL